MQYYLLGNEISESDFYAVYKNSFRVQPGSGPKVTKLFDHSSQVQIAFLEGVEEADIPNWKFVLNPYGDAFTMDFFVKEGKVTSELVMSHDWMFVNEGHGEIYLTHNGVRVGDSIQRIGMFDDHRHADITWDVRGSAPDPSPGLRFYDANNQERDAQWALTYFGIQDVYNPGVLPVYKLSELWEGTGTPVLTVAVRDTQDNPMPAIKVAIAPRDVSGSKVVRVTDAAGIARFQMDESFEYYVPGQGHWVVAIVSGDSFVYNSVGVVKRVTPKRWLNPVFAYAEEQEEPPVPPDQVDIVAIKNAVAAISVELDKILQALPEE